ncbi:hypothetical protein FHY18_003894 [Xanthomonas arboricola]|nr:hypothetical protein [Xanthomonas sp. 3793]
MQWPFAPDAGPLHRLPLQTRSAPRVPGASGAHGIAKRNRRLVDPADRACLCSDTRPHAGHPTPCHPTY